MAKVISFASSFGNMFAHEVLNDNTFGALSSVCQPLDGDGILVE